MPKKLQIIDPGFTVNPAVNLIVTKEDVLAAIEEAPAYLAPFLYASTKDFPLEDIQLDESE